ncbi:MAG: hypothetical protein ACOCRX_08275 [Candidatus Woesearchaeota archaeon]
MELKNLEELKKEAEKRGYNNLIDFSGCAVLSITNKHSIVIKPNKTGEAVFVSWSDDILSQVKLKPIKREYRQDIGQIEKGFYFNDTFYNLNDFIRVYKKDEKI